MAFADSLVPSAGQPHRRHADLASSPKAGGCNMAGFVMVKKVPGTLHFTARSEGHSFDHTWMNVTHVVHQLYFGSRPTPKKYQQLQRLHPAGLTTDWADKLHDQMFVSEHAQSTHEHYMQVGGRARGTGRGRDGGGATWWGPGAVSGEGGERRRVAPGKRGSARREKGPTTKVAAARL